MKTKMIISTLCVVALAAGISVVAGCGPSHADGTHASGLAFGEFPHTHKTGGQIWADNCSRCHNPRPATQYSAQQWEIIAAHMRVRANLSGEEQRAIYHFLSGT